MGDRLLVAVAARLRQVVAPHLLTRTGGDEFAVLVDDAADSRRGPSLARPHLRGRCAAPFRVGGHTRDAVRPASVSPWRAPRTAGPAELLRAADVALSWAKAHGRGQVVVFDPEHDAAESARFALLAGLRGASRSAGSSGCPTSRSCAWPTAACRASRRWSAGSTPSRD